MATRSVRKSKHLWFLLILVLFLPLDGGTQASVQLTPPRGAVPEDYFGLHIHHLWQDTAWPSVEFGTWRLWDAHVMWTYLEPSPGKYDFTLLDKYVDVAQQNHVELILTLAGTPTWASARPAEVPMHEGGVRAAAGLAAEPRTPSIWSDFLRAVGTRYKGKIRFYEIWNEPMSTPFFSGTPQTMVSLVQTASTVLKQIDPTIRIVSPPVSGDPKGLDWLNNFLDDGGGKYIDVYGFHFYVGGAPEKALPKVEAARALLRKYQQDQKPMWNTEAGWQLAKLGPDEASDYVARSLLFGWPSGLGRYIFYSWDHPAMGIAPHGNAGTPMVKAYATVERWLTGATVTRCVGLPNGLWVENLTLPNGGQGKVVWTTSGKARLTKDNLGTATSYESIDGQKHQIAAGAPLEASESPILLLAGGKA